MPCAPRSPRARDFSPSITRTSTLQRTCRTPTSLAPSAPTASRCTRALRSSSSPCTTRESAPQPSSRGIRARAHFAAVRFASRAALASLAVAFSGCFSHIAESDLPEDPIAFVQDAPSEGILSAEQFREALSIEGPDDEIGDYKKKLRTSLALLYLRTGEVSIVPDSGAGSFPFDWSPDGGRLLVGRVDPMDRTMRLWTWNRLTGAWISVSKNRIGVGAGIGDGPIRLAWHGPISLGGGKSAGAIWINSDGRGDEVLPDTQGCWTPDVSADGRTVVFARQPAHSKYESTIYLATLGSGEPHPVTRGRNPRFSRDGRWIVFQRDMRSGNSDIWIMRADGGAKRQVTRTDDVEEYPAISPDGRFVVYASARGDVKESHLFVARVSDGVEQEVTHQGQSNRPIW
jgi:hypothetical protein